MLLGISFELLLSLRISLIVLISLSAIFIIFVVLKQLGNSDLGAVGGQDSSMESFYGKDKSKQLDARLKKLTVIAGILLTICSITFFVLGLL